MKIFVTGATGFLGRCVVERLLESGQRDLRCLCRDESKASVLQALQLRYPAAKLEVCWGNLNSKPVLEQALQGVDVVFHLAASMKGGAADMFLDTVVGSQVLLEAIGKHPIRVVLVSSFGVLGTCGLKRQALIDESCPLEPHPEWRDVYSYSKLRQELLFREYAEKNGFELVVLRPGVIYGPNGPRLSNRIGLNVFGLYLHVGGSNRLPLTYVRNCADAVVTAGLHPDTAGQVFHVHDDDLPSCRQYLRQYRAEVQKMRTVRVPYCGMLWLSHLLTRYHRYSKGQLPAILTPYKTKALWGGNRFSNEKLKSIGWTQRFATQDSLRQTFASFRAADRSEHV